MIKYQLTCPGDHEFEGWFRNSGDYDEQAEAGLLECPFCGSEDIRKAIMAPAVNRSPAVSVSGSTGAPINPDPARLAAMRRDLVAAAERARAYVEKNFEHVGERFPEEARKIHYGEAAERGIYGEATGEEVQCLVEEGIEIAPLPGQRPRDGAAGLPRPRKNEVVKKDKSRDLN